MATVYLHIGTHKTGTTTLQKFLFENREKLKRYKLVYPEIGLHPTLKGHHPVAFYLAGKKSYFRKSSPDVSFRDVISKYVQSLEDGSDLIISSEDFSRLCLSACPNLPTKIKRLFPISTEFRVVVYLRRQDHFIESYYSWQRRGGRMMRARLDKEFCKKIEYFPYSKLLARWAQVFGKANISVRPFEKESLYSHDLIRDFLREVGISKWMAQDVKAHRLNMAYTPRQLEALDYLRDAISGPQSLVTRFSRDFIAEFSDLLELKKGAKKSMPPELGSECLKHFSCDNHSIAKTYLGRNRLFLNESKQADQEPHIPLANSDHKKIDWLLPSEVARFNKGKLENEEVGRNSGKRKSLKVRAVIHRRTVKVGAFALGTGRIVRIWKSFLSRTCIIRN